MPEVWIGVFEFDMLPCLTSMSANSLPVVPEWLLVHSSITFAVLCSLRRASIAPQTKVVVTNGEVTAAMAEEKSEIILTSLKFF